MFHQLLRIHQQLTWKNLLQYHQLIFLFLLKFQQYHLLTDCFYELIIFINFLCKLQCYQNFTI